VLRIPCYQRTEPCDVNVDSRSGVGLEDGVEMKLVPERALVQRKPQLRAELLMRMAHLTYHPLVRQIRGVLEVAMPRTPLASGEWLWARLLTKYRYFIGIPNGMMLHQFATLVRQTKSVRVSA
jgi:hypothetical protein